MMRKPRIKNRVRRELSDSFIRTCRHYGIRKCEFDPANQPVGGSGLIFLGENDRVKRVSNEGVHIDYLKPFIEESMIKFRNNMKDAEDIRFFIDQIDKISISFEQILKVGMDQPMMVDLEVRHHSFFVKKIRTSPALMELIGRMKSFAGHRAKGTFFDIFRLSFKLEEDCIISDELEEEIRTIEYDLNELIYVLEFNDPSSQTIVRTIDYFRMDWSEDTCGSADPDDDQMNIIDDTGFHVGINIGYENKYQRKFI
jgi:hypothetical protein